MALVPMSAEALDSPYVPLMFTLVQMAFLNGFLYCHMGQIVAPAILDEQMPPDVIRQAGTVPNPGVVLDNPRRLTLSLIEQLPQLLQGHAVLEGL